jgi:hypothetical protein
MPEVTCSGKEACSVCGSLAWKDAVWTGQRLICRPCHTEIRNHQRKSPPAQQTLAGVELARPRRAPARIAEPAPEVWGDHVY